MNPCAAPSLEPESPRGSQSRRRVHSESPDNLLRPSRLNPTLFSECSLKLLRGLPDFDSTIRRFESSRPSHPFLCSARLLKRPENGPEIRAFRAFASSLAYRFA
jgi:hypothetical protein